jgi:F-type H+-transporting ATPase subunit epsilon
MKLSIYSLRKTLFEGEAKSVNLRSAAGELTILDNHRPLIALLMKGNIRITDMRDTTQEIAVRSGFLEIRPDSQVSILADE